MVPVWNERQRKRKPAPLRPTERKRQKWKRQIGPHRNKRKRKRKTAMLEMRTPRTHVYYCKNVAAVYDETQKEECEYDEEADWTDWTGAVTYGNWSYGDYCDYYQDSYWTEDSDCMVD